MSYYVHPQGLNESKSIGEGTKIWAFAHVLPGARIGQDCNICDHVFIENKVVIGNRVTVKCGVQLWDGIQIEDDVFIGPNATFTNDLFPRSKQYPEKFDETVVKAGASIGANATILCGISIGKNAMIGAGAVVTRSVPPNAIVVGNPARIIGYSNTSKNSKKASSEISEKNKKLQSSKIPGVAIHELQNHVDIRGSLTVGEFEKQIPFIPKRYFTVFDVPTEETRGEHAHKKCHQYLICLSGKCTVVADNGFERQEFLLDRPTLGLYLPPLIWGIQYKYSSNAVLLVFASEYYDSTDYIRDYDSFLENVSKK